MAGPHKDCANVIAFPPLVFGAALLLGILLHLLWPLPIGDLWFPGWVGGSFAVLSALLAIWGDNALRRAGTNIKPTQPTTAIVKDGPFRFSRNPLYLSLTILHIGVALMFNSLILLLLLPPVLFVVHFGIIRREERYLEAKFGAEYLDYRRRVRRYL